MKVKHQKGATYRFRAGAYFFPVWIKKMKAILFTLVLLALAACSMPNDISDLADPIIEAPVIIDEEYEYKQGDCAPSDPVSDDGIGGTGCRKE